MVPRNGFEPSTVRVWTVCSSQLSYLGINGGDKRDRTADLRSASASLSQTELYPHIKLNVLERETRLELATLTLARLRSTNWAIPAKFPFFYWMVRRERLELSRLRH